MERVNSKLEIFIKENDNWKKIGETEVIEKNSSPQWTKKITIYDYEAKLRSELEFYVEDSIKGSIGSAFCKVNDLVQAKDKIKNLSISQKEGSMKSTTGSIKIQFEIVKREPTCSTQ